MNEALNRLAAWAECPLCDHVGSKYVKSVHKSDIKGECPLIQCNSCLQYSILLNYGVSADHDGELHEREE